jgi:hypothetical protein
MEPMEGRILLSAAPAAAAAAAVHASLNTSSAADILNLQVTGITLSDFNKQINVNGTIGGGTFSLPIRTVTTTPSGDPLCPTLHFQIAPQTLTYQGFTITTGPICLSVTPEHYGDAGQQLLCTIGQLLAGGNELGNILTGVSGSGQLATLNAALTAIFNGVLGAALDSATASIGSSGAPDAHRALDMITYTIAPTTVSAAGYTVGLDNCSGGAVTITLIANAAGARLQNALSTLNTVLNSNASAVARGNAWELVARTIVSLV